MNRDNPRQGAPRIRGESLQLGFDVSEASVSRFLRRLRPRKKPGKAKQWLTFLHNHREVIAAFDFFTVPTVSFRTLYCFFMADGGPSPSVTPPIPPQTGLCKNFDSDSPIRSCTAMSF
jgi:hypothetical protein